MLDGHKITTTQVLDFTSLMIETNGLCNVINGETISREEWTKLIVMSVSKDWKL